MTVENFVRIVLTVLQKLKKSPKMPLFIAIFGLNYSVSQIPVIRFQCPCTHRTIIWCRMTIEIFVRTVWTNLGKLGENNSSKTTHRKQLVKNTGRKTRRKATRRKFSGGKLVARKKILSGKYSSNFVIIPCYKVLN